MKRVAEIRFPQSANLFQFCKKILDHKFGSIRIIDQDVGQILGFDPADCSHWKKGKKNVRSIYSMKAIAEHLGIDEQLVVDVAAGGLNAEEGFFEFNGYGNFEVDHKFFENLRKETIKKNIPWSKNSESELKSVSEQAFHKIDEIISDIHKSIDLQEAPVYLPEIFSQNPAIKYQAVETLKNKDLEFQTTAGGLEITCQKSNEIRPHIRFQLARTLAKYYLRDVLKETETQHKELSSRLNEIYCNQFGARLLTPKFLIQKEIQSVDISKDIVLQLSERFWVSKHFLNRRLKEALQNLS